MSQPAFTDSQIDQAEITGINSEQMQESALELTDRESLHNPSSSKS